LIKSPCPPPAPMQGHRNERVGIGQQFAASARHPPAHHGGKVKSVAVFEAVYQRASDIVIADDGARPVVGRWISDRFHGQQAGPGVVRKWNAQPRAVGWLDMRESRPALRAKAFSFAEGLKTRRIQPGQGKIKDEPKRLPQAVVKASSVRLRFIRPCRNKLVHAGTVA
jgi:hypothetical protein